MMVTDLIFPSLLLAVFPFVFPIYYLVFPLFVVAMLIHIKRELKEGAPKPTTRRLFVVQCTTLRTYDYDRHCTLSVNQLLNKFDLPNIISHDSAFIFNTVLSYGFCVRVKGTYFSLRKQSYNRCICFSPTFSHVWIEEINITNYSKHSTRVTIPSTTCYGKNVSVQNWKRDIYNMLSENVVNEHRHALDRVWNPSVEFNWGNNIAINIDGVVLSMPFGCQLDASHYFPREYDSKKDCMKYISDAFQLQHYFPTYDPLGYDNMVEFFRKCHFNDDVAFGLRQNDTYYIVSKIQDPRVVIFFERNPESPSEGHVFMTFDTPNLLFNDEEFVLQLKYMHLKGRVRQRRKISGRMGPAAINARQPAYGNLEDAAIQNQILEDNIDAINLQTELLEAQQNLNAIANPPPPPGPITFLNYTCPHFSYKTIYADGKILLLVPFLVATILRFGFPLVYWSSTFDSFILRTFTIILLLLTTIIMTSIHYYNHYTTIHIVSPTIHMSNVEYRKLFLFDILFGFAGVIYLVITQTYRLPFRARIPVQIMCFVVLSLEMFVDFYISFIFFRLFTLSIYVFIYLMEGDSSLVFSVIPTGVTVDVDDQRDLRPDVFQVNKFKYQRRVQEVRIDTYTQKFKLYTHNHSTEMVDLEVFAQVLNAHFDRFDNSFADIAERMTRFIATCTTINRRKDLTDRYPTIDSSTIAFALHYIKFSRSQSALCRLAAQTLNL